MALKFGLDFFENLLVHYAGMLPSYRVQKESAGPPAQAEKKYSSVPNLGTDLTVRRDFVILKITAAKRSFSLEDFLSTG
jgi:hypothetical protein